MARQFSLNSQKKKQALDLFLLLHGAGNVNGHDRDAVMDWIGGHYAAWPDEFREVMCSEMMHLASTRSCDWRPDMGPQEVTVEQARAVAKHFIRRYVERGDTYQHLAEGAMSHYGPDFRAALGSFGTYECRAPKRLGGDAITVAAVGQVLCCHHFSLRELYDEIRAGVEQLSLF